MRQNTFDVVARGDCMDLLIYPGEVDTTTVVLANDGYSAVLLTKTTATALEQMLQQDGPAELHLPDGRIMVYKDGSQSTYHIIELIDLVGRATLDKAYCEHGEQMDALLRALRKAIAEIN